MKVLTYAEKVTLLEDADAGKTNAQLCKKYDVSMRTVQRILNERNIVMVRASYLGKDSDKTKYLREWKMNKLDAAVFIWFVQVRSIGKQVPGMYKPLDGCDVCFLNTRWKGEGPCCLPARRS